MASREPEFVPTLKQKVVSQFEYLGGACSLEELDEQMLKIYPTEYQLATRNLRKRWLSEILRGRDASGLPYAQALPGPNGEGPSIYTQRALWDRDDYLHVCRDHRRQERSLAAMRLALIEEWNAKADVLGETPITWDDIEDDDQE